METLDRMRGTLLGLAVGDALGAAVEFRPPGSFEPVTGYRGGGPHDLAPGEWTDDTSMALALADSIAKKGWDPDDQMRRYLRWYESGVYSVNEHCFDIGNTTIAALLRFKATGDAWASGDRSEHAAGNGSIMRLAPVPIHFASLFPNRLAELVGRATESSLTTHASPQCVSASIYMTLVLCGLIHGHAREEVLDPGWKPMREVRQTAPFHPEIAEVVAGSFRRKRPPAIIGSGDVAKTLEAALWAFEGATDFRGAVLRVVNLGNDADTTGAVCGQLSGAYWGDSGIPPEWLEGLARREMIEAAFAGLVA